MQSIAAANAALGAAQAASAPVVTGGGVGGLLNTQKDASEASTAPKFGEILQNMQAKYGAKAEKPREIKKTLGKDDFLRIMLTQMRHQDPTNPFKAEQMATEMAQFTSVEQLQNLNQNMQKMATQNQPLERLAMTNMIGKLITVDRDRFAHVEGQNEVLNFNLPKAASQVHLAVVSETGDVVMEKDIGPQKPGEGTYTWDGLKSGVLPAKSGTYILRVEAKDENGLGIQSDPLRKTRVVGVSFEGGDAILLVGDNRHQDKVGMKNVIRIESDLPSVPGASLGAVPPVDSGAGMAKPANFISFQKGVGSGNLDPTAMNGEVAQAISSYQKAMAEPSAPAPAKPQAPAAAPAENSAAPARPVAENSEKGFPNGLHE